MTQTTQQGASEYFRRTLIPNNRKNRELVEDYVIHMIDLIGADKMMAMDWEAVELDFQLYVDAIKLAAEGVAAAHSHSADLAGAEAICKDDIVSEWIDALPGNVVVLAMKPAPGFVCDICHHWFPENKGWLSHDGSLNAVTALHDMGCIEAHHLVMEPEEKDRRA